MACCKIMYALALAGLFLAGPLHAQETKPKIPGLTARGKRELAKNPIPDLTAGGKPNETHDWNLGPTGARGWMWGMMMQTDCARQILVTKVDSGSPADGKLKVGDVILGVGGKTFDSDARIAFGRAITKAEKTENQGRLKLLRWRHGKTETITLQLKVMGSYGRLAPMNCPKSLKILNDACEYIAKEKIGEGVPGYVNALGLLASGNPKYLPMVRDFAHGLKVKDAYIMSSWNMSYMNIFLSEYYLLTGDRTVLPKIKEMALFLAKGQSLVGTWGHNQARPDGTLLGYGAMCNPSLSCVISLVLNRKCGINDNVVKRAIRRSEIFFTSFVDRGGIPYGDHMPQDDHDCNGRCSMAAIFFDLIDNSDSFSFFARMTVASYGQREQGHTGNYWSFLWGPLGAMRAGPEAAAAFIKELEWFFDLERRWDGGFTYQGGANMTGAEHTTPGWDTTGARVLMYAMARRKLYITGKGLKISKALTGEALEKTLRAGRGYSTWTRFGLTTTDILDDLSPDDLLKRLVTWSTPMRIRAAKALGRKKGNHVPALIKMLRSTDRETVLGGVYGLEHQGSKAEPAIDLLVRLLSHDDIWVRYRAGAALCAIGERARDKAMPVLLKTALQTSPDDPREMYQRYVSHILWGSGGTHGLIEHDQHGVNQAMLVAAIKKLIRNPDGHTRAVVGKGLDLMTAEQLRSLWPDIVWAVENPAPSGIMFNSVIREKGLEILVKNRFKEGISLCAKYVGTMKQHGSQKRIYRVMDMLRSYGTAAKPELPNLYKAREYYKKNLGPDKPLNFPTWAVDVFMKGLDEGIRDIEKATKTPKDLKSLNDFK